MTSSSLSVALDATLWDEPTTGIALYTRALAARLEARGVNVAKLGARSSGDDPRRGLGRTPYVLGQLPLTLRERSEPVFHAVSNFNLPLVRARGKRFVLTVHDLIPLLFPATVSRAFRWQFRLWLGRSLKVADEVICVSETTRRDLLAQFDFPAQRVHVVHNGADHVDAVAAPDAIGRKYLDTLALPERFVVYAGALDVRKNVTTVLDACEQLWSRGVTAPLVLLGQRWFGSGPVEKRILDLQRRGRDLRALGYQPEPIFYEVLRRASVLVFPSRYEGFGLPPLEAMRLGVPTLVSNAGSLPEVCGEGAQQLDPDDVDGFASAIEGLLGSEAERRRWSARGRAQAAPFTWDRAAEQTLAVYRGALAG